MQVGAEDSIDRNNPVLTRDLHAMSREEDYSDLSVVDGAAEVDESAPHRIEVGIDGRGDGEAVVAQRLGYALRIIARIVECGHATIVGISNHERDMTLGQSDS